MNPETMICGLLDKADIVLNGNRAWDIQVHNPALYSRVLRFGTLGLGESYMEGWWDCEALDEMICRALRAGLESRLPSSIPEVIMTAAHALCNLQTRSRAGIVARRHYDLDNALFEEMLGATMNYSCGYWKDAATLDEAQNAKMELICRKLKLAGGESVLDIGCGWGGLAMYMARNYNVNVTGITLSKEQLAWARSHDPDGLVSWELLDYRSLGESLRGPYDKLVSVGMFEHVGRKNYAAFMRHTHDVLKKEGLFLLHSIGGAAGRTGADPWMNRYIFPNGALPSLSSLANALDRRYIMED